MGDEQFRRFSSIALAFEIRRNEIGNFDNAF